MSNEPSNKEPSNKEIVDEMSKSFMDKGQFVLAGWTGYKLLALPKGSSPEQEKEAMIAFYAGAQHTFGSIVTCIGDYDDDDDKKSIERLDKIRDELCEFIVKVLAPRVKGNKA
jgi:hypothetical protein